MKKEIVTWKTRSKKGYYLYHVCRITNGETEDYNRYSTRHGRNTKANRLKAAYKGYRITRLGLTKRAAAAFAKAKLF